MIHAYPEMDLYDVRQRIAAAFDYAMTDLGMGADEFGRLLSDSCYSSLLAEGCTWVVIGRSGFDLMCELTGADLEEVPRRGYRTEAFWLGYVLAYIQWYYFRSFGEIQESIPFSEILAMYPAYHECDITMTLEEVGKRLIPENLIAARRRARGLSQSELAKRAGMTPRSLRMYERGEMDIESMSCRTLFILSRELGCSMEDILKGCPP